MLDALRGLGWHASARAKAPVDEAGGPLPWYTYPAILWLGPRLSPTARVFEFGAGNSTLWYAERCALVESVDHDQDWVAHLRTRVPTNVTLHHRSVPTTQAEAEPSDYVGALADPSEFDVVVIDGQQRVACARRVLPNLHGRAIAILDNSDRASLQAIHDLAEELGLQRIDFTGPVPGSGRLSTTTIFGRDLGPWLCQHPVLPQLGYDGVV